MSSIETLQCEQITNDDGQLMREEFCMNGVRHNLHGPAIREWNDDGQLLYEEFWLNGKQVDNLYMLR